MKIGILALQGAVKPHADKLRELGAEPVEVRLEKDLADIQGIILPGGESTTMLHMLDKNFLFDPLQNFVKTRPAFGVCAGTILLAKTVHHPSQKSLGAIDLEVERNAFGRQIDSFISPLSSDKPEWKDLEGVFIRAPRIRNFGPDVKILLRWHEEPVLVETAKTMAGTFHPELSPGVALHRYFLQKCEENLPRG